MSFSQVNERNIESEVDEMLRPLAIAIDTQLTTCFESKRCHPETAIKPCLKTKGKRQTAQEVDADDSTADTRSHKYDSASDAEAEEHASWPRMVDSDSEVESPVELKEVIVEARPVINWQAKR